MCVYKCVYIFIYIQTHIYICIYIHTHTYIYKYIYIYIHIFIHSYIYIYIHIYIYTHTYIYIHIYIYLYTHTYENFLQDLLTATTSLNNGGYISLDHTHTHTHTHTLDPLNGRDGTDRCQLTPSARTRPPSRSRRASPPSSPSSSLGCCTWSTRAPVEERRERNSERSPTNHLPRTAAWRRGAMNASAWARGAAAEMKTAIKNGLFGD